MQLFGEKLDRQTEGAWVRDSLAKFVRQLPDDAVVLVDAVRIPEQIAAIRQANFRVMHIHLKAPTRVLAERYKTRSRADFKELQSYSQAEQNKTEKRVARLESIADIVVNTELCTERDVLVRAATHLGFYPKDYDRIVDVVVGGQFGSEGKGHIVSYISRDYDVLVRVGGPNAGHKVFTDGHAYTHHQLPSGTRFSQAKLVIGPGSVLSVKAG